MRKLLPALFALAATLSLATPALATPILPTRGVVAVTVGQQKELLGIARALQIERAVELEDIAAYAGKTSRELEAHAQLRDKSADRFSERAKAFNDAAAAATDPEVKKELGIFAKELEVFAKHDRDFAKERRAASKLFAAEAERSARWAKGHREAADRIQAVIARMK